MRMNIVIILLSICLLPLIKSQNNLRKNSIDHNLILKDSNQYAISEFFGGFFQENNLPDPTFFAPCYDTDAAQFTTAFLQDFFNTFSSFRLRAMLQFQSKGEDFLFNSGNINALHCLYDAPELRIILGYYNLTTQPNFQHLAKKAQRYAFLHLFHTHLTIKRCSQEWKQNEQRKCGKRMAQLLHHIY